MKKRAVYSSAVIVVLAVAGFFIFMRNGSRKYDFRFEKVTNGDLTVYVTATGTINAVTSVDVGTQVSGIVSRLYADFNSVVKAGQVIAQIDSTFLVQAVKDAEANLDRANAQFADSKRNLDREKALLDRGLESQLNYDAALTTFESNSASLKSAQASLDRAKINLAYATIYAPISGVVINRAVNVGQTVAASFSSPTLFTIANDLQRMQVQTTVDESDIGRISIGQEASFTVDAYPDEKFTGTVSQIRLAPVTIQNVVNYTVIIDVNNDQLKLMPGMTANVKILVGSTHDVLRVPNMALRFQPPAELIDSTKLLAQREAMFGRGGDTGDSSGRRGRGEGFTGGGPGGDQSPGSDDRRKKFERLRDSIQTAHGGTMSREELMAEMRKILVPGQGMRGGQSVQQQKPALRPPPQGERYGITARFPEYQKSAYVPLHQSGRARVWILNAQGKLEPVFLQTGLTDGRFTEVTSAVLKSGDQIVMGVNQEASVEQGRSPLAGQGPMGGGRR